MLLRGRASAARQTHGSVPRLSLPSSRLGEHTSTTRWRWLGVRHLVFLDSVPSIECRFKDKIVIRPIFGLWERLYLFSLTRTAYKACFECWYKCFLNAGTNVSSPPTLPFVSSSHRPAQERPIALLRGADPSRPAGLYNARGTPEGWTPSSSRCRQS